jgi:hypothetical protein
MVDEFDMVLGVGQQAVDGLASMVWGGLLVVMVVALLLFAYYFLSFRHKVVIKILGSRGAKYPFADNAKPVMIEGVPMWKLRKRKDIITPPPKNAVLPIGRDLFGKAKYYADEFGYVWAEDNVGLDEFEGKIETEANGNEVVRGVYQPVTTQERTILVGQVTKALMKKKKSLLEQITALAVPLALVALFIMVLVFWEDIAKPVKDMSSIQASIAEQNAVISQQNARMLSVLAGKLEVGDIVVEQTVPPDIVGGGG